MADVTKEKEQKANPAVTPIQIGNTGFLTVKLLDELNKMIGLIYDTNVEIHKHMVSIDNRIQIIMAERSKKEDEPE